MTIKIQGSVNRLSADDLQRERDRYQEMGWEYFPEGLSHKVRVQVPLDQIDEFCEALKALRPDKKGIIQINRSTNEKIEIPSVSIYLSGSEMAGNWIKLWGRAGGAGAGRADHQQPIQGRPAPARRSPAAAPAGGSQAELMPQQPAWNSTAVQSMSDEEIPF
jgi:hypothetical protein